MKRICFVIKLSNIQKSCPPPGQDNIIMVVSYYGSIKTVGRSRVTSLEL
jgi:hypothetical protein